MRSIIAAELFIQSFSSLQNVDGYQTVCGEICLFKNNLAFEFQRLGKTSFNGACVLPSNNLV